MDSAELEYVGFWARCGATLVDLLLQLAITLPVTYVIYGRIFDPNVFFMGFWDIMINLIVPAAFVIALWTYIGATPGKLAISARVVDADTGGPLTATQSLIRYVGYFVSFLPLCVGCFLVAFDRRKQGWHDKMANTVVIRPIGKAPVTFASKSSVHEQVELT